MQNLVIPGADNKVRFTFGGVDLTAATDLTVVFGAETYKLTTHADIIEVVSATELALSLNETNEKGRVFIKVKYHDSGTVLGTDITSQILGNLDQVLIASGSQLIIEDGTVVANANSFVTDSEYNVWASLLGYKVQATEPERDSSAVQAYDLLIESFEYGLSGVRTSIDQTGVMPRQFMTARGFNLPSNTVPQDFKKAQMMLMVNIGDGATTNSFVAGSVSTSSSSGGALTGFEIPGVIKETYSSSVSASSAGSNVLASFPAVTKLLSPYYADSGSLVRV